MLNPDFIERSQKNGTNQILLAAFSNTQRKVSRTGQLLVKLLHFLCRYQRSDSEGRGGGGMWVYRHTVGEAFEFFGKIPDPWD